MSVAKRSGVGTQPSSAHATGGRQIRRVLTLIATLAVLVGCAPGGATSSSPDGNGATRASKALTVGLLFTVNAFGTAGGTT
ncbi:MAG TPA: hypothetical protein VGK54_13250, partial [Chloroflexota bacterium]